MADRRQPDYDFFGPGQGPQTSPGQGAPPGYGQGAPPVHGPRTPAAGPLPPAPFMVPRRSTGLTVLVVAAVVVAAIVVLGIVGAVAVPVFVAQRMRTEWRSTTFVLPETFDGANRADVPAAGRVELPDDITGPVQAGSYRVGAVNYIVIAAKGKQPLPEEQQIGIRRGYTSALHEGGLGITLTEQTPGRLGGWFGCGVLTGTVVTTCVASDHAGAVVVIASGSSDPTAIDGARRLREAVEKR